jgi:hypothetical protein
MDILLNDKGQGQCPICGNWNKLEVEKKNGLLHEFTCCHKTVIVSIDEKNLKMLMST